MKIGFGLRIRILLLILGCSLIGTSISLRQFSTRAEILDNIGAEIQQNLRSRELTVKEFVANERNVERLKTFPKNAKAALNFIEKYRKVGINLFTYKDKKLVFWSAFKTESPNLDDVKYGTSVLFLSNGWYEVIKHKSGEFDFLFFIPIQSQYSIKESEYFVDEINPQLSKSKEVTLAAFADKNIFAVKGLNNKFLFALKLRPNIQVDYLPNLQIWLFVAGLLFIAAFFNSLSSFFAKRGYPAIGAFLLGVFFVVLRFSDLYFGWFDHRFDVAIFDPKIYSQSFLMPSLGDLIANMISLTWLFLFIYNHRSRFKFPNWITRRKDIGIFLHIFFLAIIGIAALLADDMLFGLVYNSKINFDIVNILKLSGSSWISIVTVCLVWFQLYLLAASFAVACKQLNVSNQVRIYLFSGAFLVTAIYIILNGFNIFFIAFFIVLFLITRHIFVAGSKFGISSFGAAFICLALITSVKYLEYKDLTEQSIREPLARKVESSDDPNAILALSALETTLTKNSALAELFVEAKNGDNIKFKAKVRALLDGYLSRYNFQLYSFDRQGDASNLGESVLFSKFKGLVEAGTIKVDGSKFFYQVNNTFGYQNYFGIFPVIKENNLVGTVVLELRSKPYNYNNRLPELLGDQKFNNNQDFKGYSVALYNNGILLNQSGSYVYPGNDKIFEGKLNDYVTYNNEDSGFNHLVFKPSRAKLVVISKEIPGYVERAAVLSFFFIVFILFSLILYGLVWIVKNLEDDKVGWFTINRSLMINANKILYKTRIQLSVVFAVVATLLIVGWITNFYMNKEYRNQQNDIIKQKIRTVQQNFEKQTINLDKIDAESLPVKGFENFAEINNADLNLYDLDGKLITTTYSKLYNFKIMSRRMGAAAYINLRYLQRSEYINPNEVIGSLTYAAAYVSIKNRQSQTIAYIGLPNYLNEEEYSSKIALFLSNLINIYALVFVGIGVLAIFLGNQITNPLTFIQQSIMKTKLGQRNEPIVWRRHDELGSLIKEYNNLIAALDESARKLARSERESAWREMAKQVAHEIKNPLTPLRLGVQLLEKSWKEQDPNFETKFNKFSKSFIEQIDSLSNIASEFSNFAKMPDAVLVALKLQPIIENSIEVYENAKFVHITLHNKTTKPLKIMADADQLLRTFNNLFKNAIEAMPKDRLCEIGVSVANDSERVYIEISDNGVGIPKNIYNQIFVPNFTTKSSGTGLGLAFVNQAVENASGSINFKSAETGTTFFLSFPLV